MSYGRLHEENGVFEVATNSPDVGSVNRNNPSEEKNFDPLFV